MMPDDVNIEINPENTSLCMRKKVVHPSRACSLTVDGITFRLNHARHFAQATIKGRKKGSRDWLAPTKAQKPLASTLSHESLNETNSHIISKIEKGARAILGIEGKQ